MTDDLTAAVHDRIDELFARDHAAYGRDLKPYRGHAHRVAGLTMAQVDMVPEWFEPIAVAAYYHDAAIWLDGTWDYLPGSEERAVAEMMTAGRSEDADLVRAMIDEHHRLRPARDPHPLVEAMRKADATDVYRAVMPPRVSRDEYKKLLETYPDAGLHLMLGRGFVMGLKERKRRNPMPMVKF